MTKVILPCSGYGKRMGMKSHESKEMLPDIFYSLSHIIDWSLNACNIAEMNPIVSLRPEKKGLEEYLDKNRPTANIYYTGNGEWPESVLATRAFWEENNILMLPDTRFFHPDKILKDIEFQLQSGCEAVLAIHKVTDPQNWGIVKDYKIFEKPKDLTGEQIAWGLIGFKKSYGEELFTEMQKGIVQLRNTAFVPLRCFQDITRSLPT